VVIGIAEVDGAPQLPISKGLGHVQNPDKAINRILQKLASDRNETPDVEPRTVRLRSKTLVLQVSESVGKRCGLRIGDGNVSYIPVRRDRITEWVRAPDAAEISTNSSVMNTPISSLPLSLSEVPN